MNILPWVVTAWLVIIGLYGVVSSRNLVHQVLCLSVIQSATYVLLLAIGYRTNAGPPIFANSPPGSPAVDPVVQALTLTDIVVEATVVALLLSLAVQCWKRFGTIDPERLKALRG
ncbi:MAG TPA: cation:proton antiporter subunit C [Chloroflexota bacterium]|jgi:multicomponent Na+:H+ antiporter subunit C|nr:cation:proton antiporter subunit C [Chloroflexota bacterium]